MSSEICKLKMLIADDSSAIRRMLSEAFSDEFTVIGAENGQEAIDILEKTEGIAVVLLDIKMPKRDGFSVLKSVKNDPGLSRIPIIAMTHEDDEDNLIHALDLGAVDVITKPIRLQLATYRVRNILARSALNADTESFDHYMKLFAADDMDEKSGLYNKKNFCRKARIMLDNNPDKKFVIFRWDIDGFKILNDVYGVEAGDALLKKIGGLYKNHIGAVGIESGRDIVYGRWEADHFVTCMLQSDFERFHVPMITDELLSSSTVEFESVVRMGIYMIEDASMEITLMCDRALLALKSIKGSFRQRVAYYSESMRSDLLERQSIVNDMSGALAGGQFVIYLQPQYNYDNLSLHGAEALVRWNHPTKGIISPAKFIPIFEKNGFISHLDQFVWEEVCKLIRYWKNKGLKTVPVSVNVSRSDITNLKLCEFFTRLIKKYELNPGDIRIEITESAYMDNPDQLINSVDKLQMAGFSVEMDDFGSGYSSLNTLKDVPVDMLKLDMKFIESDGKNGRGGSILSSVVRMSDILKLPVLAEGVETKGQADYLKSIGCIYMQGYYFAKPMPVDKFEEILEGVSDEEAKKKDNLQAV